MARYKDCRECIHYKVCVGYTSEQAIEEAMKAINSDNCLPCEEYLSTADVVPKGVVDALKLEVENEILKRERQRQILNHYALQYGTVRDQQAVIDKAKSEVAWEIFKELEKCWKYNFDGITEYEISKEDFDELKKKYTGGE